MRHDELCILAISKHCADFQKQLKYVCWKRVIAQLIANVENVKLLTINIIISFANI